MANKQPQIQPFQDRPAIAGRPAIRCCLAIFIALITGGCNIESMWTVPATPAEQPSRLWLTDPRTQGWNGVEVQYFLLEPDAVDADVHSLDGRHRFVEHGVRWYETESGQRCDAYAPGEILVLLFGDREEQYRFERRPGNQWGILAVRQTRFQ